jgi:hypothetical protein
MEAWRGDTVRAEMGCGDRISQRSVAERAARKNLFRGEAERYAVRRGAESFGLKRVVSCGSADHRWRTKLDLGGGEPLDDCPPQLGQR